MSKSAQHVLVIRMSAMGDVAMTVPVLSVLTSSYPEVRITVLTRKLFIPFFEGIPRVTVHIAEVKGKHKGPLGLWRLAKEIDQLGIDAVADLHDVLRSQIVRTFLNWRSIPFVKINKGRAEKAALVRKENKVFKQLTTSHQRYADVFKALGFPIDLNAYKAPMVEDISQGTNDLLDILYPQYTSHKHWIGIAPFAKHRGKVYPIDLMEEVIEALVERGHLILLFGGGESETKTLQEIDNFYPSVLNMAGKISLKEELRLIHKLTVMVSMDSANMHMASMVGTRVVSLWGATHPYAGFYGWQQREEDALLPAPNLYPLLPSSIYGDKVYPGYEDCMRSIEPTQVIEKIDSIL